MSDALKISILIVFFVSPILFIIFCTLYFLCRKKLRRELKIKTEIATTLDHTQAELQSAKLRLSDMEPYLGNLADLSAEERRLKADIDELIVKKENVSTQYDEAYEAEVRKRKLQLEDLDKNIENIRADYAKKRESYDRLAKEVAIFDDRLAFAEMGVYEPHFNFDDSEEYKLQIEEIRQQQKHMVKAEKAVYCTTSWQVEGSFAKGKTLINRSIKLVLRAFNNECDAAIANTRWNNVNAMEKRIVRAFEQIAKLVSSQAIVVSDSYLNLKLKELQLTYEYREKLKQEKDERIENARLLREEQKLARDLEKAEEEEARYKSLLEKAKKEAASITGNKLAAFEEQIRLLEDDLAKARSKVERAQAMAEKTRSGYVYVISNIGSFGDGIFKIGLTRRLDPMDRVRELGDASVPFGFDVHAIIYNEDAPALENALHKAFDSGRVNAINYRKEFFKVSIDEVETALKRLAPDAPFFKDIEAQDYHETLAKRRQLLEQQENQVKNELPVSI